MHIVSRCPNNKNNRTRTSSVISPSQIFRGTRITRMTKATSHRATHCSPPLPLPSPSFACFNTPASGRLSHAPHHTPACNFCLLASLPHALLLPVGASGTPSSTTTPSRLSSAACSICPCHRRRRRTPEAPSACTGTPSDFEGRRSQHRRPGPPLRGSRSSNDQPCTWRYDYQHQP